MSELNAGVSRLPRGWRPSGGETSTRLWAEAKAGAGTCVGRDEATALASRTNEVAVGYARVYPDVGEKHRRTGHENDFFFNLLFIPTFYVRVSSNSSNRMGTSGYLYEPRPLVCPDD
jgi:hypothetical protein